MNDSSEIIIKNQRERFSDESEGELIGFRAGAKHAGEDLDGGERGGVVDVGPDEEVP